MSKTKQKIDSSNTQNLSSNLAKLMEYKGLNVNQLALELKIPPMTIRRIILGETEDPRISTIRLFAKYFNISIDQLLGAEGFRGNIQVSLAQPLALPVIQWEDVYRYITTPDKFDLTNFQSWQTVPSCEEHTFSSRAFAITSTSTLYPRFPLGTVMIVDPAEKPKHDDLVLVLIKSTKDIVFKNLKIDPPQHLLYSVCLDAEPLQYDETLHAIIAVNIMTIYSRI